MNQSNAIFKDIKSKEISVDYYEYGYSVHFHKPILLFSL